jgi:hypothetical protein
MLNRTPTCCASVSQCRHNLLWYHLFFDPHILTGFTGTEKKETTSDPSDGSECLFWGWQGAQLLHNWITRWFLKNQYISQESEFPAFLEKQEDLATLEPTLMMQPPGSQSYQPIMVTIGWPPSPHPPLTLVSSLPTEVTCWPEKHCVSNPHKSGFLFFIQDNLPQHPSLWLWYIVIGTVHKAMNLLGDS